MKRSGGVVWSWFWMILGIVYFLLPLVATFLFSLRAKLGVLSFLAYQQLFNDSDFIKGFSFSILWGVLTIIVGILIFVPTAYWVRLRLPQARTAVEFITLLPFGAVKSNDSGSNQRTRRLVGRCAGAPRLGSKRP